MVVSSSLELVIPTLFHKLRHFKSYLRLEVYVHWQLDGTMVAFLITNMSVYNLN